MSPATEILHFLIVLIIQKSIFGVQNTKFHLIFFNTSFQYLFLFIHVQIFLEMHRTSVAYFTTMMNFCFLNWSWFSKPNLQKKKGFSLTFIFRQLSNINYNQIFSNSRSQLNAIWKTDIDLIYNLTSISRRESEGPCQSTVSRRRFEDGFWVFLENRRTMFRRRSDNVLRCSYDVQMIFL